MDAIHLPPGLTLPSAFGAPVAPFQPGQVIQALVLELVENDIFRLQLPQATIDVRSSVPLTPGSTITLAVKSTGASARFAIYTDLPAASSAASLAGRTPIGEAIMIARGMAGQGAAPPKQIVAPAAEQSRSESVVVREIAAPEAPRAAMTPEQAVRDVLRVAAPRQTGLAPLFADLVQIAEASESPSLIPPAVQQAAADALSFRLPLDEQLTASNVKQAFARSGVLFESRVAAGSPPAPAADLKAALLVLRQVLNRWSATEATAPRTIQAPTSSSDAEVRHVANVLAGLPDEMPQRPPMSADEAASLARSLATALLKRDVASTLAAQSANAVPPPYRGAAPTAQPVAAASLVPEARPHEIASKLIAATGGALARTTLLQVASLPEHSDQPRAEAARWNFEIPLATALGTAMVQFEVSRDARAARTDPQARSWRVRFSLDIEPMGPVHALIGLAGSRTSVTLWAERATTATRFNENAAMLTDALRAAELEPAEFSARLGVPPAVARQAAPGRFMDRAS